MQPPTKIPTQSLTLAELRSQVRRLKEAKGFDVTLAKMAGVKDLEGAFRKKAASNEDRQWRAS